MVSNPHRYRPERTTFPSRRALRLLWIALSAIGIGCSSSPAAGYRGGGGSGGGAAGAGGGGAEDASGQATPDLGTPGCTPPYCGGGEICDPVTLACRACASNAECALRDPTQSACVAGTCRAACASNAECASDPAGSVCDGGGCRPCVADVECTTGAGVCIDTAGGHCAGTAEALFVEYDPAGCAGADGSSAHPYCTPGAALAAVTSATTVVIVRGPAHDPIAISTNLGGITIVGIPNATGAAASVPAAAGTAILASAGVAHVRDLALVAGTASVSIGIAVTGTSTELSLMRVTIALGTGLGAQVAGGGLLSMSDCVVENNSVGGLRVDGGGYSIGNSVFASNGYGIDFTATPLPFPPPSSIGFVTIVDNAQDAVRCDPANVQTLLGSIVAGPNDGCALEDSATTVPPFDPARPYHLTASFPCPEAAPDQFPVDDIDGNVRMVPVDCGADQFVAAP